MIPNWDNSARYGKEAYILHGSTPEIFQEWLEKLIQYSENHLPLDKQFIIVNAWNEWAEGTHLEPDTRFGYSYLNSIGRALSNVSYDHYPSNSEIEIPSKINLKIDISNFLENKLVNNIENGNKFIACLAHSNIFNACNVIIDNKLLIDKLDDFTNGMKLNIKVDDFSDYTCLIEDLSYFSNDLIDNLLKKAIYYKNSTICANVLYNSYPSFSCKTTSNRSIDSFNAFGIKLFSNKFQIHKNHRIFPDDICIIPGNDQDYQYDIADKNDVTTIIRFHNTGDQSLLKIALISLFSQNGCNVLPYIAIQDFDDNKYSNLVNLICQFPWQNNCRPIIKKFYANESITDLRSKMLNESLKNISTRFVAFLDYDDFLFPYAYKWLLNRIKTTGKAISFGNLYVTYFNRKDKSIIKRIKAFEYGTNYYDFIKINHTPIHGFMIDLTKVDLNNIKYYDDMKYMEDYYFTLQIFNENNCDWDSLKHKTYIGDYFHSVDAEQTLAFTEDRKRFKTISNSDYIKSEKRINDLRYEINKNIYLKKNG